MAQPFKINQRLLATLNLASRYYRSRPTLLNPQPAQNYTTGFAVTFDNGNPESITAQPGKVDDEPATELGSSRSKDSKSWKARMIGETRPRKRLKSAAAKQAAIDASETDFYPRSRKQPTEMVSRPRRNDADTPHRAIHAVAEGKEAGNSCDVKDKEEHLQKDYPDTRTIDDAGRLSYLRRNEATGKLLITQPAKSRKAPAAYRETWQVQKAALKNKFGKEGWNPRKRLSPDTMEGIRALHAQYPEQYSTPVLAEQFAVTPEAIRRILKSKWSSNAEPEELAERRERWAKRHDRIWDVKSELGLRPRRKDAREVEDPDQFEEELKGRQLLEAHRNA